VIVAKLEARALTAPLASPKGSALGMSDCQAGFADLLAEETLKPTEVDHMNFRPLADRILIKRIEEKEQKHGNIIVPDSAKEKPMEGKVIAVGSGKRDKEGKHIALEVKVGDRVLFGKYAGTEIKIDNDDRVILKEDEVLAVIG
jgi:chaperonin GroES